MPARPFAGAPQVPHRDRVGAAAEASREVMVQNSVRASRVPPARGGRHGPATWASPARSQALGTAGAAAGSAAGALGDLLAGHVDAAEQVLLAVDEDDHVPLRSVALRGGDPRVVGRALRESQLVAPHLRE